MRLVSYERQKRLLKCKWFVAVLCVCLTIPTLSTAVFAYNPLDTGLCKHHPVHTADCGYEQGRAGTACGHKHTDNCYETVCIHAHDENCGDMEDKTACTHKCSADSGCVTLVCSHKAGGHDDSCGYREEVKGKPCGFVCPVCSGKYDNSGVEITVPKKFAVDPAADKVDLIKGVSATDEDGKDYHVSVYSVASKDEDYVWDKEKLLSVKGSDTYTVVYVAEDDQGDIVAAEDVNVDENDLEDVKDEPADTEQKEDGAAGDTDDTGGDEPGDKPAEGENPGDGTGNDNEDEKTEDETGNGGAPSITNSQLEYADEDVKVTVKLPEGVEVPEGYDLFVEKVPVDDPYYPSEQAVEARASETNDYQCYRIRWKNTGKVTSENPEFKMMNEVLGKDSKNAATIRLEYINDASRLYGPAGGRKLLIFNSLEGGSLNNKVADTVTDVTVNGDYYTSFTFDAMDSGPYVFVSKKVEKGYISGLSISEIIDGSAPFDNTDTPGNDSGKCNKIVRSYDTIQYTLTPTFAARQEAITASEIDMYFELSLEKSATAARFDVSKMLWLGDNYSIEYLDKDGKVILVMAHDGKFYAPLKDAEGNVLRDLSGFAKYDNTRQIYLNEHVSGSKAGENSYKVATGGVAKQKLIGKTHLKAKPGESILAGTQSFTAAVEVRNADNNEMFSPTFKIWLEGNEENYGKETLDSDTSSMLPAQICRDNEVKADGDKAVKVSAGTNFNAQLKKNTDMSYKNWFDFKNGNLVEKNTREELTRLANRPENHGKSNPAEFTDGGTALTKEKQNEYANYRYGRITCYGITLQLYNDTDNDPGENRAAKGLRGLSLPVGDITFDLNLYSEALNGNKKFEGSDKEYTAILWDYNENIPADQKYKYTYNDPAYKDKSGNTISKRGYFETPNDGKGNGGRNIFWDGEIRSPYAKGGGPSNYRFYHDGCYYGGDWSLVDNNNQKVDINTVANPIKVTGTGAAATYHFSVSDYDFDFDTQHFPKRDAGNSGNITGYNTYARCFSAGCVQVLSVFPMVQKQSEAEIFLNTKISNLKVMTRVEGQVLEATTDDSTGYAHEVNKEDNTKRDQIVLYAPGNLTKGNAFNGKYKGHAPNNTTEGFLGTEYWTTSYDCSAFAGDEIWITSYGMLSSGSDNRMRSMNLLQLFDSRALSIRDNDDPSVFQNYDPKYDIQGEANFLYAVDPKYLEGYDTNKTGMLEYMNSVREEDLRYFKTKPDAQGNIVVDGEPMKCIGVLMELRGCDLLGGKYQYMRIPVKVNGNDKDLIGKTVATVNTFRVWSYDLGETTWANGQWNGSKNTLVGYPIPDGKQDGYYGQLYNGSNPPNYVKTEYKDGHQVSGTHAGGTLSGNSLLILSYKAHVNIGVDNKGEGSGIKTYNQDNSETVVDYRLTNIKTEISDFTSQTSRPTTTLRVQAVLDEGHTGEQRIFVSGGTYRMSGYAVGSDGKPSGAERNFEISSDEKYPTKLMYKASDGSFYTLEVYAALGAGSKSVTFVIKNAPVGLQLPDITFQANLASAAVLNNNDTIKASAYISGTGDNRAYDEAKGNTDNVTVGIVMGSGTNLTKSVNERYIELGETITYNVIYTNSGTETIDRIFFYDLLPMKGDIRGSDFEGDIILRDFDVTSGKEGNTAAAGATVYYSTTEYWELYNTVKVFGGKESNAGTISGMDENNVNEMLKNGENKNGEPLFYKLGEVDQNGTLKYDVKFPNEGPTDLTELMRIVTGLYVDATNLQQGQTIKMRFVIESSNNEAADWYKNIANSWIAGSDTRPLTSNKVETQVVSRNISGVVWYDKNLNGVRDKDEPLLENVECTLFKKEGNGYVQCTENVLAKDTNTSQPEEAQVEPITTGKDGAYSFDKLAAGDYIVAFSGTGLEPYTSASPYQINNRNDSNTNDGKAIGELGINIGDYDYYIHYSNTSESMELHPISEMGSITLNNGVEQYSNQDLGVTTAIPELPKTGGTGTLPYTTGGILLVVVSLSLLGFNYKRKRYK